MVETPNYLRINNLAYNVIKEMVAKYEDIQDLVQIVSMKYFLNLDKIDKENEYNWVYITARNAAISFLRKKGKTVDGFAVNFDDVEDEVTKIILEQKKESRE